MAHVVDPELRPLQVDVYMAIREAWLDYGMGPTQRELSLAVGCSDTSVVYALRALRRKGYITAPRFQVRASKPTDLERTLAWKDDPWDDLAPVEKFFKMAS